MTFNKKEKEQIMKITLLGTILLAAVAQAAEVNTNMLARTGGIIMPPDNGNRVVLVNSCQANTNAIFQLMMTSEKMFHIPVKLVEEPAKVDCPYKGAKAYKGEKAPAVIYIYKGEKDGPILTVYMEDAIATINTTPLRSMTSEIEADRLAKELLRGYGVILGGYYSAKLPSVLEPVYGVGQIDNIRVKMFSPMHLSAIMHGANLLELPLLRPTTYQAACRMGWAPAPTNEYQKAIWDAAHNEKERGPAKALKIVPPGK